MKNRFSNVLFDLDGTLTNPKEGIVNSILYALNKLGIIENRIQELETFIGPPLRESFMTRYNLSENFADKAVTLYRDYFSTKGLFENELYSGIPELLQLLVAKKYKLFVATSKPTIYAVEIIKHFRIDQYFVEIIGSNLDNTRTDKTEVISHVVSTHQLIPSKSVMVGDRKHDIIGAKNNFLMSIGVTYGFGSLYEITLHQPDYIVNSCDELKSILTN